MPEPRLKRQRLKVAGGRSEKHRMADPWMTQDGNRPPKPFDRRALQATLADAVRTQDDVEVGDRAAPAAAPVSAPRPAASPGSTVNSFSPGSADPAGAPATGGLPVDSLQPRSTPPRSVNPFGKAPAPAESGSLLGGGLGGGGGGLSGGTRPPAASLGAPTGLSGLRPPGSEAGSINLNPAVSTPTDRPTIPLRRPAPRPAEAAPEAAAAAPAATPAGPPPVPRNSITIEGWSPTDDDILPPGGAKRKSFRVSRR
jgi:hypothetical protein